MKTYLIYILLIALTTVITGIIVRKKEKTINIALPFAAELFVLISLGIIVKNCTVNQGEISFIVVLPVVILSGTAILAQTFLKNENVKQFIKKLSIMAWILLIAECIVFNAKALTSHPFIDSIEDITATENAELSDEEGVIELDGETAVIECVPDKKTRAIGICMEKEDISRMIEVAAYIKDDNFSREWKKADKRKVAGNGEAFTLNIDPYKTLYGVKLEFSNISDTDMISEITVSSAQPFRFMTVRYLILLLVSGCIMAVRSFGWHRVTYDRSKLSHRLVLIAITVVCTCSPLVLAKQEPRIIYNENGDYSGEDIFIKTFDAFRHGKVSLDIDIDDELENLSEEEIYDYSVRSEEKINYMWDHAYKDGKYYSYFGITPIVTLYYPLYLLTHTLPTLRQAIMFFSVFAALFTCLAVIAGTNLLVRKPNMVMLAVSLPVSVAAVGVFYANEFVGIYVLPLVCAICFLMLSLWLGFKACESEKKKAALAEYLVSGIALGLCAGARPSTAISAAVLIPLFLGVLLNKREKLKDRLIKAAVFVTPLFIIVVLLLIYNNARFGSYTDFGAAYQLTVSNVNANNLRIYALPDGIYHYLLQVPQIKGDFPLVSFSWQGLENYERYRFTYNNMGILWIPVLALGAVLFRTALRGDCVLTPHKKVTALQKKAVLITGVVVVIIVSWMDFCLAGSGAQYIFDVAPVLCICTALIMLSTANPQYELRYRVQWVASLCSVAMITLMLIGNTDGTIHEKYPLLYQTAESMILFWH